MQPVYNLYGNIQVEFRIVKRDCSMRLSRSDRTVSLQVDPKHIVHTDAVHGRQ